MWGCFAFFLSELKSLNLECKAVMHIDDTQLLHLRQPCKSEKVEEAVKKTSKRFKMFLTSIKMKLNPDKTTATKFGSR